MTAMHAPRLGRGAWLMALWLACPADPPGAVSAGARWAALSAAALTLAAPGEAEARRFGGGRSFGFRGSRGFGRAFGGGPGPTRGYRGVRRPSYRRGFGFPMFFPFFGGWGYGFSGLLQTFLVPLVLMFILRLWSSRR